MMNFTTILVLIFTSSWIITSGFEFHSMVVQPGEEVTLLCSNFSRDLMYINWFKLTDGPSVNSISSMMSSESEAKPIGGFGHDKFQMTSNGTNIFLNIKQLNFSDSGVYICGTKSKKLWRIFSETYLQVEEEFDGFNKLPAVILGGVVIFLIMVIIGLVWKIRISNAAQTNKQNQQGNENLDSDALNYAALNFTLKAESNRRPAAEREMDPHVLYAATR